MKRKALYVLAASALLLTSGCNPTVNDPDISFSSVETITFSVSFPSSQVGYSIVGENSVKQGEDYSFYVSVKDGYDSSKMVVSANGAALSSTDGNYLVSNVQSNLAIEVSGVFAVPSLELSQSCYRFYLGHIEDSSKEKAYFLNGVKGSYGGVACEVDVDISKIDFASTGTYEIVYTLVGHSEVSKKAKVTVLPNPDSISDVTIDISSIYEHEVVPESIFGEANVDFTLSCGDHTLTSDEVYASQSLGGNFLSKEYLKTLSLGEHEFKIYFDTDVSFPFKVTLVDDLGPSYSFPVSDEELCFTLGSVTLPEVAVGENSIQNISSSYKLGDEAKTKDEILNAMNASTGDYSYTVSALYNGATVGSKKYSIHVRDVEIPFVFSSTGSSAATKNYSKEGDIVLNFDSSDDTNVALSQSYIQAHNTANKKYVLIAFRILSTEGSPSMWYRDPEVCFDASGNYVSVEQNDKYNGASIGAVGSLSYATFALNGDTFENDVWIMRNFHGSVKIASIAFCDLGYVDPIIDAEQTRGKLANITSSFDTIWNYFHCGAHGTGGGASMAGDCVDIQPNFKTDMEKVGYTGARLTLKFDADSNVKKVECWEYDTTNHLSSCDAAVSNDEATVDLPLSVYDSREGSANLRLVFNTSETSGSTYTGSGYVSLSNFYLSSIVFY